MRGYIMTEKLDKVNKEAEIANQVFWDDDSPDYSEREYISKNPTYEWTWP